jgi:hypothetical protein
MLALARALLGLIRPLRHGCVPFPRSTFASRGPHTRTAGVPPACAHDFVGPSRLVPNSTGGVRTGQTFREGSTLASALPGWLYRPGFGRRMRGAVRPATHGHTLGCRIPRANTSGRRWLIHAPAACPVRTGRRPERTSVVKPGV